MQVFLLENSKEDPIMKIERLSQDKIRIFLTFDDLTERGIQKDDMWREIPKVHELFSEMMDQAYSELGFDPSGPLAVEVFALPAQGMVVIVTRGKLDLYANSDAYDDQEAEEVYEMEVTLEQSDLICYAFKDFEDLLQGAKVINPLLMEGGILYSYKGKYILQLEPIDLEEAKYQALIAVLSEYGEASSVTRAVLEEYGKVIISDDAVKVLCHHFH
jgi:adapter protein MecA 1/2